MAKAKLKFRLHRTAIVLICLALLVLLMQGASYFSLSHQLARSEQVEELAKTLAKQVTFSLSPIMDSGDDDIDSQKVDAVLQQLTQSSRILMPVFIRLTVRSWPLLVKTSKSVIGWL